MRNTEYGEFSEVSKLSKLSQLVVLDQCVIAGFYALVVAAALSFSATLWLTAARAEDYMAASWICIFGAAVCLLMRLAVLVWQDVGEPLPDQAS
jgi:hypothetical protein